MGVHAFGHRHKILKTIKQRLTRGQAAHQQLYPVPPSWSREETVKPLETSDPEYLMVADMMLSTIRVSRVGGKKKGKRFKM